MTDPASFTSFIDMLRKIREEVPARHVLIGNWLYCLRNLETVYIPEGTINKAGTVDNQSAEDDAAAPSQGSSKRARRKREGRGPAATKPTTGTVSRMPLDKLEVTSPALWISSWRTKVFKSSYGTSEFSSSPSSPSSTTTS